MSLIGLPATAAQVSFTSRLHASSGDVYGLVSFVIIVFAIIVAVIPILTIILV